MAKSLSEKNVYEYLAAHKKEMINKWEKEIFIADDDPYKHKVKNNGLQMLHIVIQGLATGKDQIEVLLRETATKVAAERVEADISIGDFVCNISAGRSIIIDCLLKGSFNHETLRNAIAEINYCFDRFLYYAISHYTELINNIIKKKNQFIDATHKDRLTLLGQMTSSFIHEFRNPLTSIRGFIQLLRAENPDIKYLNIISSELEQLNFRISQFLMLSKKELIGKEKTVFSINQMLDEVLNFLYPSILDNKVHIINDLEGSFTISGYYDEIRQVLINIIFNAIDALSQCDKKPVIEITGRFYENNSMKLDIGNNGPMIPDELLSSIFEPFVTTKDFGTGIGLFVSKEIIEKHLGTLTCKSTDEKTVFTIVLPLKSQPKDELI